MRMTENSTHTLPDVLTLRPPRVRDPSTCPTEGFEATHQLALMRLTV